ncbi:hypothetical protein A9Q78_04145 [Methylophaga sp. 41_12_T18]|nr:hypothetical protein A9Q78_04145 [Methylophaga sp. 41_12_T18]
MAVEQEFLDFDLMAKSAINGSSLPLSAKQLEAWLTSLPMMDVMTSGKQVESYLYFLNQTVLTDKLRYSLLEVLRPIIKSFADRFLSGLQHRMVNLSIESKELFRIVAELNNSMAEGYLYLLQQQAKKNPGWLSRKKYVDLTLKSVFYLGEQLHFCYLLYAPQPKAVWSKLHKLYSYACHHELHDLDVVEQDIAEFDSVTIARVYKRLLLQAMVSPNSLKCSQLQQIYQLLITDLDGILISKDRDSEAHGYFIDSNSDGGPININELAHKAKDSFWKIDCSSLINQLDIWVKAGGRTFEQQNSVMSVDFLTYLILMLKAHYIDIPERIKTEGNVSVIKGLTNIFAELKIEELDEPDKVELSLKPVGSLQVGSMNNWEEKDRSGDVWDKIPLSVTETLTEQQQIPPTLKQKTIVKPTLWSVVDSSPRGYRIKCQFQDEVPLAVGELLLVMVANDVQQQQEQHWQLATVCWLNVSAQNGEVNMGIHVLGKDTQSIQVAKKTIAKPVFENCLLLDVQSKADDSSILMSRNFANTGDVLLFKPKQKVYKIRIEEVVWFSDGFAQFHFQLLK